MVVEQLGVILVCLSEEVSVRSFYSAIYPDLFKWSQFPLPTTIKRVHFLHLLQHPMSSLFMCTDFFCCWLLIEFILLWIVCFISFGLFSPIFLHFYLPILLINLRIFTYMWFLVYHLYFYFVCGICYRMISIADYLCGQKYSYYFFLVSYLDYTGHLLPWCYAFS